MLNNYTVTYFQEHNDNGRICHRAPALDHRNGVISITFNLIVAHVDPHGPRPLSALEHGTSIVSILVYDQIRSASCITIPHSMKQNFMYFSSITVFVIIIYIIGAHEKHHSKGRKKHSILKIYLQSSS